jgi:hypothetical protein
LTVLAPLALAAAALAIREASRSPRVPSSESPRAAEFAPLALFERATRAPGIDQVLEVDASASRCALTGATNSAEAVVFEVAARGTLSIDAPEAALALDLVFASELGDAARAWPALGRLALRAGSVVCRSTQAPGTRACELRARWSAAGKHGECSIAVTWMRLPGGLVRLQGVLPIAALDGETSWWSAEPGVRGLLAFDLTFKVRA